MSDDILDPPAALGTRPVDFEAPWLGLLPFTDKTRRFFFGREAEIRELFLRIRNHALTVLYSQSGLGKTSLVGAGLLPKLRADGYRPILVRLRYEKDDASPVAQTRAALALACAEEKVSAVALLERWKGATLWEALHDAALRPARLAAAPPVLIFDQFEDVFTRGKAQRSAREITDFALQLSDLVEDRLPGAVHARLAGDFEKLAELDLTASPHRLVISLREDFLSHLEEWKAALPSLMRNRMPLKLLTGPQALEAVVGPGRLRGPDRTPIISEATGNAIVHFLADVEKDVPLEEIEAVPPLLSLLCYELNERRIAENREEIVPTDLSGRAEDILRDYYHRSLRGRPRQLRLLIEEQLLSSGEGHRQPVNYDTAVRTLTPGCESAEAAEQLVGELINERLLTVVESGKLRRLELTHDILCPIARRSRDARHEEEEKERLLQEAEAAKIREHEAGLRAEAQSRQLRRTRRLVGFVTLLALVCLAVIAYGIVKARESAKNYQLAENERAKAVTLRESAEKERNHALELLREQSRNDLSLALERASSGDKDNNFETIVPLLAHSLEAWPENKEANLYLWLLLRHGFAALRDVPEWTLHLPVTPRDDAVVWSADGKMLAATGADGRIAVFTIPPLEKAMFVGQAVDSNAAAEEMESTEEDSKRVIGLWSDSKTMLVTKDEGGWIIFDLSGKESSKEIPSKAVLTSLSPDRLRAIAVATDKTATVVEVSTGRPLGKAFRISEETNRFVWKSDGHVFLHFDPKGKLQRRDGYTGAALGEAFGSPPISAMSLGPSGDFALVIPTAEEDSRQNRAEVWRLQTRPDRIQVIERPLFVGWHPLTGRLLFTLKHQGSKQLDPATGKTTPYAGFFELHNDAADTAHPNTSFAAKGRRSLLELPWGISATRTYDFADEDWAQEGHDPGESGISYLLSPDGFDLAECQSGGTEPDDTGDVELYALRGPQTYGWRKDVVSNTASPVISPDGHYEIGNADNQNAVIRLRNAGEDVRAIPLPFADLSRVEWSADEKTLILIASSGREQHWPWPPPQSWEPALHPWLAQFAPPRNDSEDAPHPKKDPAPEHAPGTAEPSAWLEPLRNAKLKDSAWQELQQWWLNGRDRAAAAPKPAP